MMCPFFRTVKLMRITLMFYLYHYVIVVPEALAYAESVGAVFVESSAKTAVNVSALFYEIGKC